MSTNEINKEQQLEFEISSCVSELEKCKRQLHELLSEINIIHRSLTKNTNRIETFGSISCELKEKNENLSEQVHEAREKIYGLNTYFDQFKEISKDVTELTLLASKLNCKLDWNDDNLKNKIIFIEGSIEKLAKVVHDNEIKLNTIVTKMETIEKDREKELGKTRIKLTAVGLLLTIITILINLFFKTG